MFGHQADNACYKKLSYRRVTTQCVVYISRNLANYHTRVQKNCTAIHSLKSLLYGVVCLILHVAVLAEHRLVTDRQTEGNSIYWTSIVSRGKNRSNRCGDIAILWLFQMAAAAILDFQKFPTVHRLHRTNIHNRATFHLNRSNGCIDMAI